MLVAGVTGGASLIESARIRSFINEVRNWKLAVLTFRVEKERLPGDLNSTGKIGYNSGQVYNANSFGAPYNGSEYAIPNVYSAPFIELYLNDITDFQPKNTTHTCDYNSCALLGAIPFLKSYKQFYLYFEYITSSSNFIGTFKPDQFLTINLGTSFDKVDTRIFKKLDEKLDDGIRGTGNIFAMCDNKQDYDYLINNKMKCSLIYYSLDSLNF